MFASRYRLRRHGSQGTGRARTLRQQVQRLPSRDPHDPNFRRLWCVRYADDMLRGLTGTKRAAMAIKQALAAFLRTELHLELSEEKTLVTQAHDDRAMFLGYKVHVLHENSKHDHRRQRCINSSIGLRVPQQVLQAKRAKYLRGGKPKPLPQRTLDDAYSIGAQYQAEYRGLVPYYRMAYNLHVLQHLKHVLEVSLAQTLAKKHRTTCAKISKRYGATIHTDDGVRKVLRVTLERDPPKKPLTTDFGGVSLTWNKWVCLNEAPTKPVWSGRSEVVERLLAQTCELCGSHEHIEVHHVRKLADLVSKGCTQVPP